VDALEKISLALQRILERDGTEASSYVGVPDAPALGSSARRPGEIVYAQTKCFDLDPAVLERHTLASVRNDTTADSFRLLRTQILMQMRHQGWQTLAVTSPNKGAGKSTIALNLAMTFAMEADYTALLVDADLRDPDLRNMLELEPGPGLVDYLLGR